MLDLPNKDLAIVCEILQCHIPEHTVWAFGSRVQGKAKPFSDLDLVVMGPEPLSLMVEGNLKRAFDESLLPIKIDVLDWQRLPLALQQRIEREYIVIQSPKAPKTEL